jgi:hypothetical protein
VGDLLRSKDYGLRTGAFLLRSDRERFIRFYSVALTQSARLTSLPASLV